MRNRITFVENLVDRLNIKVKNKISNNVKWR